MSRRPGSETVPPMRGFEAGGLWTCSSSTLRGNPGTEKRSVSRNTYHPWFGLTKCWSHSWCSVQESRRRTGTVEASVAAVSIQRHPLADRGTSRVPQPGRRCCSTARESGSSAWEIDERRRAAVLEITPRGGVPVLVDHDASQRQPRRDVVLATLQLTRQEFFRSGHARCAIRPRGAGQLDQAGPAVDGEPGFLRLGSLDRPRAGWPADAVDRGSRTSKAARNRTWTRAQPSHDVKTRGPAIAPSSFRGRHRCGLCSGCRSPGCLPVSLHVRASSRPDQHHRWRAIGRTRAMACCMTMRLALQRVRACLRNERPLVLHRRRLAGQHRGSDGWRMNIDADRRQRPLPALPSAVGSR